MAHVGATIANSCPQERPNLKKLPPAVLTRLKIESVKPSPKRQRLFDGRGLYLEISPTGGR
jgi:hypothetical protein